MCTNIYDLECAISGAKCWLRYIITPRPFLRKLLRRCFTSLSLRGFNAFFLHWLWMIYEVKIHIHIVPDRILWIGQMQCSPHFWSPYLRFHPLASYVWEVAISLIIHGDIRQAIIVRSKPTNKPQPDASTSESKHDLLFRLPHPAKSSNHHRQLV